jgi:AraC family transcriptional regulator
MEPKIISKPAFTIIGLLYHGNNAENEIPQLWGQLMSRSSEIQNQIGNIAYGAAANFDEASKAFDYVAGFEVSPETDAPQGMVKWNIPARTYVVFTCTLPTMMDTYKSIHETWFPQSDYQRAAGPEFELYGEKFDPNDPNSKMDIYIPVSR